MLVVGEKIEEFVAENGDAAGFEADDGSAGRDFGGEFVEDLEKKGFGAVEHAVVVEGAAAAEVGVGDKDAEAGDFEDRDSGFCDGGLEIVIEGVGPEKDGRTGLWG